MFRFANPYYFVLLLCIPLAVYVRAKKRFDPVMGISTLSPLKGLKPSFAAVIHKWLPVLKYATLVLMIIAMARPQWGTQQVNITTEGINIILAIDISESMAALDFKQEGDVVNRLEAVKGVVNAFIAKRNGDRIGMVVFGSEAYTQLPLTRDYSAISTVLNRLEIGAAGKSTAIGDAIGISIKRISDIKSKSNIIILLTDGRSNSGEISPDVASDIASQKKIKIYAIGVGSKGKVPFLVKDPFWGDRYAYQRVDIDEDTLKEIARKTGGRYYRARDTQGLEAIYNTIDELEKTEVKVKVYSQYNELYVYFLISGFLLMAVWGHFGEHPILEGPMKFVRMEMLFLIWSIPVLMLVVFYGVRRRRRIVQRYALGKCREVVQEEVAPNRRRIKWGLVFFGLLFLIFSLTGPQYGYHWQEMEQRGVDIMIALDCSKSMLANDIQPTRLDRAKREVVDLLHMLKGDRVGLVAFAGTAFLQCPLTIDYQTFYLFLDTLTPGFLPVGGTDLSGAIETAVNGFNAEETTDKAIILITDGENTGNDPAGAIEKAKTHGIKVFTIGVGNESGVPVPSEDGGFIKDSAGKIVVTRLDEKMLKEIALSTNGLYVRSVAGDMDLVTIYEKEIRGKMESASLSSGKKQVWEDRFQWFLIVAILLFMIDMFMPQTAKTKQSGTFMVLLFLSVFFGDSSVTLAASTYSMIEKGIAAYDTQDYETALKHFTDAQVKAPDKAEIYYNIGNAYYKLKDYDAAIDSYTQALNTTDEALKQKARYNLGNARFRRQQIKEAITEYEDALKLNPEDQQAKDNLAFAKKVLEQQKQQPQSQTKDPEQQDGTDQQNKNQDSEKQKKDTQNSEENNPHQQPQKDGQEKSENQKSDAANKDKEQKERSQQKFGDKIKDPAEKPSDPQSTEENGAMGQQPPDQQKDRLAEDEVQQAQAERMLNRLKDTPGKALIPTYNSREVEKDW